MALFFDQLPTNQGWQRDVRVKVAPLPAVMVRMPAA